MSFANYSTSTLVAVQANLLRGLDIISEHVKQGTLHDIPDKKHVPVSQGGQVTLWMLLQVDAELDRRHHSTVQLH